MKSGVPPIPRPPRRRNRGTGTEWPVAHPPVQLPTSLAGSPLRFDFYVRSLGFDLQGSAHARDGTVFDRGFAAYFISRRWVGDAFPALPPQETKTISWGPR